jgi:hypothetical protein
MQDAALQLEIVEAVAGVRGLGEADHRLWGESRLVTQAEPLIICMRLAEIGQIGLVTIADIEQVSQSFDGIALLAFAQ